MMAIGVAFLASTKVDSTSFVEPQLQTFEEPKI
jgi:hypothetical protein